MAVRQTRLIGLLVAVTAGVVGVLVWSPTDTPAGDPVAERQPATSTTPTTRTTPATTDAPTSAPEPPPTPEASCARLIGKLSQRERVAQLLMVGVDPSSPDSAVQVAGDEGVGGIFIGGTDPTLLVDDRLDAVRKAAKVPIAISVDEEGGRVQRVEDLDGDVPSAREMAKSMTVAEVHKLARDRGAALHARGVTVDFAPVVDVTTQRDDDVIGDRAFGSDPAVVTRYAGAFARGLRESGVLPVIKHFPGHGRASGDSHTGAARTPALADLRRVDLLPYHRLLGSQRVAVMVGHMAVPGLTGNVPATLSPATYRLLRGEFSFDDIAITDDLGGMQAVSSRYPLPKAVLAALTAGADVAFWSSGEQHLDEVLDTLERAVADRTLPATRVTDSLTRVLRAKGACRR
ncbi:glycoside hydrolase family 3 N-terminal domain-containing protein [Actinophytocola sp.]|uniref:glycoside hydrolase family 3 N-terminal domain-containing protein n=1 Tax=Actinophytocola sp. TaxID=1872138 RepID=UPI003D6A5E5E